MKNWAGCIILCLLANHLSLAQTKPLGLDECIAYGLSNHTTVEKSALNQKEKEEVYARSVLRLAPRVRAKGNLDHYWEIPVQVLPGELLGQEAGTFVPVRVGTPYNATAALEAEVDLFNPGTWTAIRMAAIEKQIAAQTGASERSELVRNIIKSYHTAVLDQQQTAYDSLNLLHSEAILAIARKRFEDGLLEQSDLNTAKKTHLKARQDVQASRTEYHNSLVQLKFWMGMPLEAAVALPAGPEPGVEEGAAPPAAFSPGSHPGYDVLQKKILLAGYDVKKSRLLRMPLVSLRASYSKQTYANQLNVFNAEAAWFNVGLVGLRVEIPLVGDQVQRNINLAKIGLEKAKVEEKEFGYEQSRRFESQKNTLAAGRENVRLLKESLQLAAENQEIFTYKFKKGVATGTELQNVQQEVVAAQQAYLQAVSEWLAANTEMSYLTGKFNY